MGDTSSENVVNIKKNRYTEEITCDLCGGKYKKCNKSHHYKTKLHTMMFEKNKKKEEEFIKKVLENIKKLAESY